MCGVFYLDFPLRADADYNQRMDVGMDEAQVRMDHQRMGWASPVVRQVCIALLASLTLATLTTSAPAATEAHILRIDPRTAVQDGDPVLTTVIDITESHRVGELAAPCATLRGDEQLDCISQALNAASALSKSHPFVEKDALFTIRIGDKDHQAELLSHTTFKESQDEPRVGTAWLIIVDADARVDKGFDEAKALAARFVDAMGPSDLVNIIFVSDRQVLSDTKWLPRAQQAQAHAAIAEQKDTVRSQGRTRPLLDLITNAASDSFRSLGSSTGPTTVPLHQAMVVIANGFGGGDPSTTGPGAEKLAQYFTKGRFDDENTARPKLPTPVISIFLPPKDRQENQDMARVFMQNLANPSIGGFFTILRDGQVERVSDIVDTVRARFQDLVIARFRLACVAPTTTQSFSLVFRGESASIAGDSTFKDVPVGFDPSSWPLDIDTAMTRKAADDSGGVQPGGTFRVFGNFCWGGDLSRPEAYFLPPGEHLPQEISESPEAARKVQKRLTSLDMRATAIQANSTFAEFRAPDAEQILHGENDRRVVRVVVVDSRMQRTSGLSESTVLTLKGAPKKLLWWPFAAAGGALLLILVGLGMFLRRGTNKHSDSLSPGDRSRIEESPYATPSPVSRVSREHRRTVRATLEGNAGRFVVLASSELRAGRDSARVAAVIDNPQVSGLHASLRIEGDRLLVRDEGSSSGTRIDDRLIESGRWEEVADGAELSLGPERLRVTLGESS